MQKENLNKLFDNITDGIIIIKQDFTISYANKMAENYLDITKSSELPPFNQILLENFEFDQELINDFLITDCIQIEAKRKDFEHKHPLVLIIEKFNSSSQPDNHFYILLKNITFNYYNESRTKDFLSIISHKLRTPVVALGYAMNLLLNREALDFSKEEVDDFIQQAQVKSLEVSDLIEKLIQYATISLDKDSSNEDSFDLKTLLTDLISKYDNKYKNIHSNYQINLNGKLDYKIPLCSAYVSTAIEAVIDNGIKFNDSNAPKIDVSCETNIQQKNILLSIKDNGIGIPAELRESVFHNFSQLDRHGTGEIEGLGLGLCAAKKILESLGQQIKITSSSDKGSIIQISLPL